MRIFIAAFLIFNNERTVKIAAIHSLQTKDPASISTMIGPIFPDKNSFQEKIVTKLSIRTKLLPNKEREIHTNRQKL